MKICSQLFGNLRGRGVTLYLKKKIVLIDTFVFYLLFIMFAKSHFDPELERLRKEIDGPPNLDTIALNIQRITSHIHASYLFRHIGKSTLQKLCLLLSSTATGKGYSGWQEFAAHLGLTIEQIRYIDYNNCKGQEDPTYYVLLAYVQRAEATIGNIINTLQKMHRYDVINQIKDDISYLRDVIQQESSVAESSILKTKSIPRAPLILTPLEDVQEIQTTKSLDSENTYQNNLQKNKQKYGCVVMLTFAEDGLVTAQDISKIFRSNEPKIGVLILQEQEYHVYSKAEAFINDCFNQVDFIIPILTKGYLEKISISKKDCEDQNKLDSA
ncbi:uncharacterized protein LOC116431485 isoform X2 [Nomia melanderi]|uniref:uncharacterized protein LOC116431485 isoform X2 n=1 Tax=Nomia melanderi TaxID=2448451 RepID=UPI00130418D9|nr:uncharacterized protein LOC116431485 isoform X2 [Nomia melanderi]